MAYMISTFPALHVSGFAAGVWPLAGSRAIEAVLFSGFRFAQQTCDGLVALCGRDLPRCLAAFVLRFGVCTLVDEEFDDGFGAAPRDGNVECRIARIIRYANIETRLQKES